MHSLILIESFPWKVIGIIAIKGDTELPERKRLIFWAGDIGQKKKRVLLQDGSVIYLPLPPVMQLRFEDFFKILFTAQHHLHPNSRILSE